MDPYELDDEYRDHVGQTDWLNPTDEEIAATIGNPLGSYTQPCNGCGLPFAPEDAWHLRAGYWFHEPCAADWDAHHGQRRARQPRSTLAARIVAEGPHSPTLRRIMRRFRCE